jgi:hypothetical protein
MILVFPTVSGFNSFPPNSKSRVKCLRSFNKDRFNRDLRKLVSEGWEVHHVTSSFRKTAFGGVTTYFCELRRGVGSGYGGEKK